MLITVVADHCHSLLFRRRHHVDAGFCLVSETRKRRAPLNRRCDNLLYLQLVSMLGYHRLLDSENECTIKGQGFPSVRSVLSLSLRDIRCPEDLQTLPV